MVNMMDEYLPYLLIVVTILNLYILYKCHCMKAEIRGCIVAIKMMTDSDIRNISAYQSGLDEYIGDLNFKCAQAQEYYNIIRTLLSSSAWTPEILAALAKALGEIREGEPTKVVISKSYDPTNNIIRIVRGNKPEEVFKENTNITEFPRQFTYQDEEYFDDDDDDEP